MASHQLLYSIRPKIILKYFGYSCLAIGFAQLILFLSALTFYETTLALPYLVTTLFSLLLGWLLKQLKVKAKIQFNEAVGVICSTYIYSCLLSSFPLTMGGLTFEDALFEAVSGITTTGLSMIQDFDEVSPVTFISRSWLQWIGGLGIMLFSLAFFIKPNRANKELTTVDSGSSDLLSSSLVIAKGIIAVYLILTLAGIVLLLTFGESPFNATLITFQAVSTGGFLPFKDSAASLGAATLIISSTLSVLAALSLPFYYRIWRDGMVWNLQITQCILLLLLITLLATSLGGSFDAWVQAVSTQTTTGITVIKTADMTPLQKLLSIFSMLIGGGTGSTAGGFKIMRLILVTLFIQQWIMRQCLSQHTHFKARYLGKLIEARRFEKALLLFFLYILTAAISWTLFVARGYDPFDSLFEVSAALGSAGLTTGITSPELPLTLKLTLCIDMLLGRLEIIPWLILIYPGNWLGARKEAT